MYDSIGVVWMNYKNCSRNTKYRPNSGKKTLTDKMDPRERGKSLRFRSHLRCGPPQRWSPSIAGGKNQRSTAATAAVFALGFGLPKLNMEVVLPFEQLYCHWIDWSFLLVIQPIFFIRNHSTRGEGTHCHKNVFSFFSSFSHLRSWLVPLSPPTWDRSQCIIHPEEERKCCWEEQEMGMIKQKKWARF